MKSFYLKNIFTLDLRSLALLRIGLGLISLYNLSTFYPNTPLFFGPLGVLPLSDHKNLFLFSFHAISDNNYFILSLFVLHAIAAILLLLGYQTRIATFACWILTASLFNRIPEAYFGGDDILKILLLWGMFLPLGTRFSVDAIKNKAPVANHFFSMASVALILQLVMVYVVNGFGKVDPGWNRDLTALYYFFNDHVAKAPAITLLRYPELLMILTCLTLYLERFGTFLLFLPTVAIFRGAAILLFIGLHLCIDLTLKVGWFSWVMILYWLALIPSGWWDCRNSPPDRPALTTMRITNLITTVLLVVVLISNVFYMQSFKTRTAWHNSLFYKIIHYAALDQNLLKFATARSIRHKVTCTPIFAASAKINSRTLKKYRFDHRPYFRTGRILYPNVSRQEMIKHYGYLKEYLKHTWNTQFSDGPPVIDVEISVKTERVLPFGNKREFINVEKF